MATIVLQQGVDSYAGMEDTYLQSYNSTYNFGATTTFRAGYYKDSRFGYDYYIRSLQRWNVTGLAGLDITSVVLSLVNSDNTNTTQSGTLQVHSILPANTGWVQGTKNINVAGTDEPCWDYCKYATQAWAGSAGCGTSGTDYAATPIGSGNWIDGTPDWIDISLDVPTVVGWITGANNGIVLRAATEWSEGYYVQGRSADDSTTSLRPKLTIVYSEVVTSSRRRRLICGAS